MTENDKLSVSAQPLHDVSDAPMPSAKTLRKRKNVLWQFLRFIAFDLRIMGMVAKGHGGKH